LDNTVKAKADQMWLAMSKGEQNLVRFGMLPAVPMLKAQGEGFNGKDLAVALMDCAKSHGGMIA
jgi:hypothetical protein